MELIQQDLYQPGDLDLAQQSSSLSQFVTHPCRKLSDISTQLTSCQIYKHSLV